MEKVRTNTGKFFDVICHSESENAEKKFSYYVYAVNEKHAQQIVESYDADAVVEEVEEQGDAISQHYGE